MKKGSVGFKPENLVQPNIASTWRAMESLYDSGKARDIGVSNFSTKKLGDLLEIARIPPAVNQVECHPSWRQDKLQDFCNSKDVLKIFTLDVSNSISGRPSVCTWADHVKFALRWTSALHFADTPP
ncbi:NADPH-dependent aldo-keto reductase [Lathyrus oleraceus]|uniref:NADPH-dependent aldo-keto reductase n=1 Tax=Pisum sativum TaxID=3888 RepID=A0A9D4YF25_PEA|nr:NADPH-dependent aldo-keto reductase [Pisum sativum]